MGALVVYESMFGNTKEIACAIAEGIGGDTRITRIALLTGDALKGVDLLVVGAPTHGWGMSRRETRREAGKQGAPAALVEVGVRERIPELGKQIMRGAAAFDTRVNKPRVLTGAASKGIARMLRRLRYNLIVPPESFLVSGAKGPLVAGELERARAWGQALRATLSHAA